MNDIHTKIGENLKNIRKARGLTIDALSESAGVSKSMISEIERGIRNPSITTLWNLANCLKIPLNSFLKDENRDSPMIYKMGDHESMVGSGFSVHPLMNFDEDKRFEMYFNEYTPNAQTEASAHYHGVEEYVLVASGTLVLCLGKQRYVAHEGEVIHFVADQPHYFCNETDAATTAFTLMFYPK